jgi:hypothetical protein
MSEYWLILLPDRAVSAFFSGATPKLIYFFAWKESGKPSAARIQVSFCDPYDFLLIYIRDMLGLCLSYA